MTASTSPEIPIPENMGENQALKTETSAAIDEIQAKPRRATGVAWILIVISILSSAFLFALDNTIVADIQPAVVRDFESVNKLTWLPVAFLLGASSSNLLWGQYYTYFDAKIMYIICVLIFEVGSAVCGAAPSMDALIVGRTICGFGGAGMYTGVLVLLSVQTTEQERPVYLGFTGLAWGLGTILGPILGGSFTNSAATWRWSFYLNLVIGGACAPVYLFLLPSSKPAGDHKFWPTFRSIDYLGSILLAGFFATGFIAIAFGGTIWAWSSGASIALFVVSGVLCIIFFAQQVYCITTSPSKRIFPLEFLQSKTMIFMFLATAAASTSIFVPVYFIPLYYQFVRSDDALQAGINLLPFIAFNVTLALLNGGIMGKKPYYMPWYVFAGVFCIAGSALLYTVDEHTSNARIWGYSILIGAGSGAFIQLSFTVIQHKVELSLVPVAVGFCTLAQLAGPGVSLVVSNAVFLNKAANGLQQIDPNIPRSAILKAISVASSGGVPSFTPEQQARALHVIVKSMSNSYLISLAAGSLTLIMSFFMKPERLFPK
ncbi:MFS drug efflux transporter [Xylaria nigripes]|nr:MFS drug efflux transporter [Xylaria nigripes]